MIGGEDVNVPKQNITNHGLGAKRAFGKAPQLRDPAWSRTTPGFKRCRIELRALTPGGLAAVFPVTFENEQGVDPPPSFSDEG